ncbi:MAG: hypothetical protein M1371_07880 [Actinobacteria bacterium]|nr:hypothetical protein [Actinomycetota bacterium]
MKNIGVDSDGDISELIPLWMEAGINSTYPLEVAAGMNVEKVRKEYPDLVIWGGIDKVVIAKGRPFINEDLLKVRRVLDKGGYIPFADHTVIPDTSFENYKYFRDQLNRIISSDFQET